MITIGCALWEPNEASFSFSRCYDRTWVERLYRGFARNLTQPFRFVCFTEWPRKFCEPIDQEPLHPPYNYTACLQPYRLGVPMILVGLDTIVTGNVDHLADYCLSDGRLAVPRDPYDPRVMCNGVALVPGGRADIWDDHDGRTNDMDWIRAHRPVAIDDLFPGHVLSFKAHVRPRGLGDARIVYFHGEDKPHQVIDRTPWVREHWR